MKCPKCRKDMEKKKAEGNVWYYECPNCHYTIGKPTEVQTNEEDQGNTEEV